jgi:hypothetical protein
MFNDTREAAEAWYNDSLKTKQDLLRWYAANGGTENLDDLTNPTILREDWADVVMAQYAAHKLVTFGKHVVDIDVARHLMDDEICEQIHGTVETEQEFMDAYVTAHYNKYGKDFTV